MKECINCPNRTIEPRCHNTCLLYKEMQETNKLIFDSKKSDREYYAFTEKGALRNLKMREGLK